MPDNIKLEQYNLKSFLYNFFIIWNLLIIVLLILLTYYFNSKRIISPRRIRKDLQLSGQYKLHWQSKKEFQNIDADIFYIDVIKSNNDKIYDFVTLSRTGHLTVFDGQYGHILFTVNTGPSRTRLTIVNDTIIMGNTNGKVFAFTRTGRRLWENQIADLSRRGVSKKEFFNDPESIQEEITNPKATNLVKTENKKIKNQRNDTSEKKIALKKSNIVANTIAIDTGPVQAPFLKLNEKLWKNRITGKILDIHLDSIQTRYALFSIDLSSGKITKSFKSFNSELTGLLAYGEFNNDCIDDFLVCETNSIHCLDGQTLKELWQRSVLDITSGNKNVIVNHKKEIFIILPCFNGIIKILNRYGIDVFEIKLNENLLHPPLVFKNKYFMFLQQTTQNNLYAFNFEKRKNIWSISVPYNIKDVMNIDLDYDNINELLILTETGKIYIINSENGNVIDSFRCIENAEDEKATSNLAVFDIDNDNNFEICFTTDKGNVYVYKYILYNKRFILRKIIKSIKSIWMK